MLTASRLRGVDARTGEESGHSAGVHDGVLVSDEFAQTATQGLVGQPSAQCGESLIRCVIADELLDGVGPAQVVRSSGRQVRD
jgi:hypothetical protein